MSPDRKDESNSPHETILAENRETALYQALLQCRNEAEIRAFMADLCTRQELGALAERLLIARLLSHGGLSYRDISAKTGASTTTVGRVARFLQQEPHRGYQLVLERLKESARNDKQEPATD